VVIALSAALTEVLGSVPEIGGKDGGTDAAWIYQKTGHISFDLDALVGRQHKAALAGTEMDRRNAGRSKASRQQARI
jgi:hypothetical protein